MTAISPSALHIPALTRELKTKSSSYKYNASGMAFQKINALALYPTRQGKTATTLAIGHQFAVDLYAYFTSHDTTRLNVLHLV